MKNDYRLPVIGNLSKLIRTFSTPILFKIIFCKFKNLIQLPKKSFKVNAEISKNPKLLFHDIGIYIIL